MSPKKKNYGTYLNDPDFARTAEPRTLNTSVALDDALLEILDARTGSHGGRSVIVRTLLGWCAEILRRERPELADAEWNLIRDTLNGTVLTGDAGLLASGLALEIGDACRLDGAAEKWGVDGGALVARIDALGFAARVAVLDDVLRFWARAGIDAAALEKLE